MFTPTMGGELRGVRYRAGVAELADAADSKSADLTVLWVRVPPPVPTTSLSPVDQRSNGCEEGAPGFPARLLYFLVEVVLYRNPSVSRTGTIYELSCGPASCVRPSVNHGSGKCPGARWPRSLHSPVPVPGRDPSRLHLPGQWSHHP